MQRTSYFTGLDLGQQQDPTALVIVEQKSGSAANSSPEYAVRHLRRWPLGTPYPTIVEVLQTLFTRGPTLLNSTLVIDATGVGLAVVDMVTAANLPIVVKPLTITSGQNPGDGTVPKKDLVGAVQAVLQTRRLRIAKGLQLAEALTKELEMFRVTVTAARNETFASWRERDHDDLVLALALAVWYGERHPGSAADCYSKPVPVRPGTEARTGLPSRIWS